MQPWIKVKNVRKKIDDFQFGPVSLTIEPGTITALVGNNGSGKSTLLKLIMNLANVDEGEIQVFGKAVDGKEQSWKETIAFQPQKAIGWNAYTGEDLKRLIAPLYKGWNEKLFEHMVQLFGIPLDKRFGKLSPGMQQKLSLSLTLPRNTTILILDEPTASLDIPSKKQFMELLVDWMETGERAVILTTHHPEDLRKLADYLFLIKDGQGIGYYEKDMFVAGFRRYWLENTPDERIRGELFRFGNELISDNPDETEQYLKQHAITVIDDKALELDEIISLLLEK